jgi:transposase
MDQIHRIRQLYFEQGLNFAEIAATMNLDWRTVRKYVDMEDFNLPAPVPEKETLHESKLDPYKETIDSWLIADKKAPRKQRHTAKRVFTRLKDEYPDFD